MGIQEQLDYEARRAAGLERRRRLLQERKAKEYLRNLQKNKESTKLQAQQNNEQFVNEDQKYMIVQGLDGRLYRVNIDPQYNKHPKYAQYSTTFDESNKFVPSCCTNDSTNENFDSINVSMKKPVQPKFSTNDTEQIQETTGRRNTNTS